MHIISSVSMVIGAIWVLAFLYAAASVLKLRSTGNFFTEHGFFTGGLALLAVAPLIAWLVYTLAGAISFWSGGPQVLGALLLFAAGWRSRRQRLNPKFSGSAMSYREKSAALMLAALGILAVIFFGDTWDAGLAEAVPIMLSTLVLFVIILIAGHTAIAVLHSPLNEVNAALDERDRVVQLRSMRNAYYLLTACLWVVPVIAVLSFPVLLIAKVSFAILLLSELAYYGSVVAYYRFGAE